MSGAVRYVIQRTDPLEGQRMTLQWARWDDASALVDLWCSARDEIGLAPHVCNEPNRIQNLKWMEKHCLHKCVLIAKIDDALIGFLMFDGTKTISYVVVSLLQRGKGVGPLLVREFLRSDNYQELKAEARNERSRRMLERCGFIHEGDYDLTKKYPILVWRSDGG
jgi:hypothetical protein